MSECFGHIKIKLSRGRPLMRARTKRAIGGRDGNGQSVSSDTLKKTQQQLLSQQHRQRQDRRRE